MLSTDPIGTAKPYLQKLINLLVDFWNLLVDF